MRIRNALALIVVVSMLAFLPIQGQALAFDYNCNIDNKDNQFWSDQWEYIDNRWVEPEIVRYFWNDTSNSYNAPALENQTRFFNFTITTNVPCNMWVAIIRNAHPGDAGYIGPIEPIDDGEWLSTSGNVLYATGPYEENMTTSLSGSINASWWEDDGWYRFWIDIRVYNETLDEPDTVITDTEYFYMNKTLEIPEIEIPLQTTEVVMPVVETNENVSIVNVVIGVIEAIISLPLRFIEWLL